MQYFWDRANWAGNRQVSDDDLNHALGMKAQEVADLQKIGTGFAEVNKSYQARGYIDAAVQLKMALNDVQRLATYDVAVDEGIQYHMGHIRFTGIPDRVASNLLKKWKIKTGETYDGTYPDEFLKKVAFRELLDARIALRNASVNLQRDKQKATVDVEITFR